MHRVVGDLGHLDDLAVVEVGHGLLVHGGGDHAGVAAVAGEFGPVLLGVDAGGAGLDAHRQVLGHQHHVLALELEVLRDGEDAGVVVAEAEAVGQRGGAHVVQLDVHVAAVLADRERHGEVPVQLAQVVEDAQRLPREVAEVGVVALGLELGDHDDRQHDVVLGEAVQRERVREQHRGVQHVGDHARLDLGEHLLGGAGPERGDHGGTVGVRGADHRRPAVRSGREAAAEGGRRLAGSGRLVHGSLPESRGCLDLSPRCTRRRASPAGGGHDVHPIVIGSSAGSR